ncbi:hypothetical protein PFNF54_02414 [Plasmodium falciparum NF54]|uniref:Uncharacterized protein n=1 Tax=Plasmodium falciparum (isolate NF54) TaxID=5843 RepID=W7K5V4_PLAFO|nr:hypothetical protein PFNF54_02414 [Plasmodium falciparum NF54]
MYNKKLLSLYKAGIICFSSNYILNDIKNNMDYSMDNIHRAIDNLYYEH